MSLVPNAENLIVKTSEIIRNSEGFVDYIYSDSVGVPTIGYGIALVVYDTTQPGGPQWIVRSQTELSALFNGVGYTLTATDLTNLQDAAAALNGSPGVVNPYMPSTNISGWTITQADAEVILQNALPSYEAELENALGGSLWSQLDNSKEGAALLSMYFNSPTTIGSNLKAALGTGDRQSAWYEIRYNTNGGASAGPGIAKRRYYEAEVFGLYNDPGNVSDTEAKQVYQTYTQYRDEILIYEQQYSAQVAAANSDYGLGSFVQPLEGSLDAAYQVIRTQYIDPIANAPAIDVLDVQVAGNGQVDLTGVQRNGYQLNTGDHVNDLLIGDDQANVLKGEGGDDVLYGGEGNDFLYGGSGSNYLNGGEGRDSYVIEGEAGQTNRAEDEAGDDVYTLTGEGTVEINDQSGTNTYVLDNFTGTLNLNDVEASADTRIFVDGQLISGIKLSGGTGTNTWTDPVAGTVINYTRNSPLTITTESGGTIVLDNHADGDFGIHLGDEPESVIDNQIIGVAGHNEISMANLGDGDVLDHVYSDDSVEHEAVQIVSDGNNHIEMTDPNGWDGIEAGFGDDYVYAGGGVDNLSGGSGNDVLVGGAEQDFLVGGEGDDHIYVGEEADAETAFTGTEAGPADTAYQASDVPDNWDLFYLTSTDVADGGEGNDILYGDSNADVLLGGAGSDLIGGGAGDDIISGDGYYDPALGGSLPSASANGGAADTLYGAGGNDQIYGGIGGDFIYGQEGDDQLFGQDGNDYISGGLGADLLQGGLGNDLLEGNEGDDQITGGAGDDVIKGGDGADLMIAGDGNDLIYAGSGEDLAVGSGGDDTLYGEAGNDELQGGIGNDVLFGGEGEDILFGQDGNDELFGGADNDQLVGGNGNDLLYGNDGNDMLFGQTGDDEMHGGLGVDSLYGGEGHDVLYGGDGDDVLVGEGGDDILNGGAGNDQLQGGLGNDSLSGGAGNDTLFAEFGDDVLRGGSGANTYVVRNTAGAVVIDDQGGSSSRLLLPDFSVSDVRLGIGSLLLGFEGSNTEVHLEGFDPENPYAADLIGSIEFADATLSYSELLDIGFVLEGTPAADVLNGTALDDDIRGLASDDQLNGKQGNDTLDGGEGNDRLDGGLGDDLMIGGVGDDTYVVDSVADVIVEQIGEGNDTAIAQMENYILADNVENLELGAGIVSGFGNSLNNRIIGNDGANDLYGGAGANTLVGGLGDDTYFQVDADDEIVEASGGGIDRVVAERDYVLNAGVENLELTGTTAINGTGNALDNRLIGNASQNTLDGGSGNDWLDGRDGVDELIGGAGDDTLDGSQETVVAIDTLAGGTGNDTYFVNGFAETQVVDDGGSSDSGDSDSSGKGRGRGHDDEHALGRGHDEDLRGGKGRGHAYGYGHNNDGGGGDGGSGGGTEVDVWTTDIVTEAANEGHDVVYAAATYALTDNVEDLHLLDNESGDAVAWNATGNNLDNLLAGNSDANVLTGQAGNDTYLFDAEGWGQDTVVEAAASGEDVLKFGAEVGAEDLYFSQDGDDFLVHYLELNEDIAFLPNADGSLESTLLGEADTVRIQGGATNPDAIDRLELDDGSALEAAQIQNLISVTAALIPNESGSVTVTQQQMDDAGTALAAAWS